MKKANPFDSWEIKIHPTLCTDNWDAKVSMPGSNPSKYKIGDVIEVNFLSEYANYKGKCKIIDICDGRYSLIGIDYLQKTPLEEK